MLSLVDLVRRIRSGELRPEDAIALSHRAIEEREAAIGAFAHVERGAGPAGAGPLNGIAVGLKDIVDTADMPTAMGSPIYAGWRPRADAAVAAAFRRLGATIIGKTTTTPFAFLDPTGTRNPRNPEHTPGGSSAGSAAAVAAGMVPLALGTQTGGSVIRPASFCGVAAVKPSFRLLPTVGVKTFSWTLDTVGLFAAGVADAALGLELLSGRPMRSAPLERPRIGIVHQPFAGPPEEEGGAALEAAEKALARAGAVLVRTVLPEPFGAAFAVHPVIQDFEAASALASEYDRHRAELPPLLGKLLDEAQGVSPERYDAARKVANAARRATRELFCDLDVLVTFAAPGIAPRGLGSTGEARFNRLWTLLGTPCVAVPGFVARSGMPVGIQVVAPFARDALALGAAAFVERALAEG